MRLAHCELKVRRVPTNLNSTGFLLVKLIPVIARQLSVQICRSVIKFHQVEPLSLFIEGVLALRHNVFYRHMLCVGI